MKTIEISINTHGITEKSRYRMRPKKTDINFHNEKRLKKNIHSP